MKELREQLLKSIAEKLAPFDFVLRKKEHHFRRKFEGGTHTVSVNFIPHPGIDFDFTGGVAIRFEAVEQLVEGLGLGLYTMGCEFGNLRGVGQLRWTVAKAEDVGPAALGFQEMFVKVALPYFEKYSDQKNALDVLAGNGPANWLHSAVHGSRCSRAVVFAYLLKGLERMQQLIAQNMDFLKARNDQGLPRFEEIVRKLRTA